MIYGTLLHSTANLDNFSVRFLTLFCPTNAGVANRFSCGGQGSAQAKVCQSLGQGGVIFRDVGWFIADVGNFVADGLGSGRAEQGRSGFSQYRFDLENPEAQRAIPRLTRTPYIGPLAISISEPIFAR